MSYKESTSKQIVLVTGPASSGKSEWAEHLAKKMEKPVIYIATAQSDPTDQDWQARIKKHILRRPPEWETLLVPKELAATIRTSDQSSCLLIDSLGTWLANLLSQDENSWKKTRQDLLASLESAQGYVILVGEETGWGVVPAYPLGRKFRERLGTLVREVGVIADVVYLVTGGHALNLSALGTCLPRNLG